MRFSIFLLFAICSLAVSAENSDSQKIKFSMPFHSPEKAVELAKKYLIEKEHLNLRNYTIGLVEFRYYSSSNRPKNIDESGWTVSFDCKPDKAPPGCDILIGVSNDKEPKFKVYPGM